MLKIIPLGGLGEIGLNMMAFEYEGAIVVVDAGLMFPEDYMLGIDYVIPDFSYLKTSGAQLKGVVLTHAHEDHIGALPYLLREFKVPVFGTKFTLGMVRHKLEEHDLLPDVHLVEIRPGATLHLGHFDIEFIRVAHSVVDGVGIALNTPAGLIVHTGDFKIGHSGIDGMDTDLNRFARLGEQGVLALLSDSTNVEKPGYTISDRQVGETLAGIASESNGRIIVALFASSIARIQQIVNIAERTGRKIVFNGKSVESSARLACEMGYLTIGENTEIEIDDLGNYSEEETIIVTTGSQGEPMSALARMAGGVHKHIEIQPGDTVILSSKFIPGNEKAIANIINNLYRRGADVIYEKISAIHVSGHAFREELKLMIQLTRPRYFIPVHGEYRHLVHHARLAREMGIPEDRVLLAENGRVVVFDENGGRLGDTVETGRVLIDGKGVGDIGRSVLKERRVLSEEGLVMVSMVFDEETGVIIYGPEILSKGFVFQTETGHLLDDAICVVLEIVEEVGPETPDRVDKIRSKVQTALRQYFYFTIGRRPVILPFIQEI